MNRRTFLGAMTGSLLAAPRAAAAQQPGKVYRIGFLRNGPPPETFIEGLRTGLRELGYVEGQNMEFVDAGGLMAYRPDYPDLYRRAAIRR